MKLGRAITTSPVLAALVFILFGCGAEPKKGGQVVSSLSGGDPGKLAFDLGTTDAAQVAVNLYDGLTTFDPDSGEVLPKVADSWSHNADLTEWTFKLKDDYKFCNGEPVDASSFKAGWEATTGPAQQSSVSYHFANIKGADEAGNSKNLTGVTAPDKYTLKVKLKEGQNFFDAQTSHPAFSPVPERYYKKHKKDFAKKPVGNGPFCVTSYKPDRIITTKANRHYKGEDREEPKVSKLDFRIFSSTEAGYKAFLAGDVDEAEVPLDKLEQAKAKPDAKFISRPLLGVYFYGFKVDQKPWSGRKGKLLRQAINYAIDRQNIVDNVQNGNATVATGFTPPGIPGYRSGLSPYNYDPDRAKELLIQAGYPAGKGLSPITLGYNAEADHEVIAAAIQKDLKAVGIEMKLKGVAEFTTVYIPQIIAGKIPFFRMGWIADYPTYDNFIQPNFDSATIPDGDMMFYREREVDRLIAEARRQADMEKSQELYRKAEEIIFDDPPIVPLYFYKTSRVVADKLEGYTRSSDDTTPYEALSVS